MTRPGPTLVVAFVLSFAAGTAPASAGGIKVATPLLRVADPAGTARGSVAVKLSGEAVSVTISVAELGDTVAPPLGVFLEDGTGVGDFTQVAAIASLSKGAGSVKLTSGDGPPPALGVADADELVGRMIQLRDAGDVVLLDATIPELAKFTGTKLTAKLSPPPGAPLPAASATLKGTLSAKKGSERFRLKAKKLAPDAAYALFVEDQPGSGTFALAGDLDGSLFERDTADGDRLPLEVQAHADLVGRALQLRDGDVVVLAGTVEDKLAPAGLEFPLTGVIILEGGPGGEDRYLRRLGTGPLYRTVVDLAQVSTKLLADEGDALWRLDQVGATADGPVCTVRLATDEDVWWEMGVIGPEHYVIVRDSNTDPATLVSAQFVLHLGDPQQGKPAFLMESLQFPGEYLRDEGHILTANGVKVGPGGGASLVLH